MGPDGLILHATRWCL